MKPVIVLGIGNRLMEDDGIGVHVVEELKQTRDAEKIRFVVGETDTDYCLSELFDSDVWIIIDGSSSGKIPGTVDVYSLKEIVSQCRPFRAFHDFDLFHAMKRENLIKDGILITVEVASVGFSTELSAVMESRFAGIVMAVREIIDQYVHTFQSLKPTVP